MLESLPHMQSAPDPNVLGPLAKLIWLNIKIVNLSSLVEILPVTNESLGQCNTYNFSFNPSSPSLIVTSYRIF